MQKATTVEVYDAIDSERTYQLGKWGNNGRNHEIAAWILYMQSYLNEAQEIASRTSPETVVLDIIRKVTTMGIVCMEEHGAPKRYIDPMLQARADQYNAEFAARNNREEIEGLVGNEILPVHPSVIK